MKLDDLKTYAWRRLGVRKHLAGRQAVGDLVEIAVQNWDSEKLRLCSDEIDKSIYESELMSQMKRQYEAGGEYGTADYGFIWMFILSSIASAVIKILIEWWWNSGANRAYMETLHMELNQP